MLLPSRARSGLDAASNALLQGVKSHESATAMPTISSFFGIIIYLYFFDDERHGLPHIHARYQDYEAVFSITDGSIIVGSIPTPKARLVQAWIEIHREELSANWQLAVRGLPPFSIDPLR